MCLVTVDPIFRAYVLGNRLCFDYSNYPQTTFSAVFLFKAERHPVIFRTTSSACERLRQEKHSLFLFICFDVLIPEHCEIQNCPVLQVWSITVISWPLCFNFCDVLILLSIRLSPFHLWKAWLLPPSCSYMPNLFRT